MAELPQALEVYGGGSATYVSCFVLAVVLFFRQTRRKAGARSTQKSPVASRIASRVASRQSLLVSQLQAVFRWLYGGEADEAIRFMEPEPVPEPTPEPVPEASTSAPDRERELEVLRAIVGVSGAGYFGTEGHPTKQFGVNLHPQAG